MATLGEHLLSATDLLVEVKAELASVLVELAAARVALEAATAAIDDLNEKIPAAVDGKLPVGASLTFDDPIRVTVDDPLPVTTNQLPSNLQGGKLKVTGLL